MLNGKELKIYDGTVWKTIQSPVKRRARREPAEEIRPLSDDLPRTIDTEENRRWHETYTYPTESYPSPAIHCKYCGTKLPERRWPNQVCYDCATRAKARDVPHANTPKIREYLDTLKPDRKIEPNISWRGREKKEKTTSKIKKVSQM